LILLSHSFVVDGNQVAIQREEVDQKVDRFEFEPAQVYTVDVVMSTGEGKPTDQGTRTTVFKRAPDQKYMLKMKASRYVMSVVDKAYTTFPFTIRAFNDERQARMGVVECINHKLLETYPVLYEKSEDIVAHFKYTVLLLQSGTSKVTGLPVNVDEFQSEKKPREEVLSILATSTKSKKKKKKKKTGSDGAPSDAANPPHVPGGSEGAAPMETSSE